MGWDRICEAAAAGTGLAVDRELATELTAAYPDGAGPGAVAIMAMVRRRAARRGGRDLRLDPADVRILAEAYTAEDNFPMPVWSDVTALSGQIL